jgi:glycosyltransferase involved in cell wall biosynthesis
MWEKGWKVIYFPLATAFHVVGASSATRPIRSIYHFHKSCYLLYDKYIHWPLSILKPFAFLGLAWRFYIASLFHLVNYRIAKQYRQKPDKKPIEVIDKHSKIRVLRIITRTNTGRPDSDSLTKRFDIEKIQSRLPLKILLINQYYPPDTSATANVAHRIAEILSEKHSVTVLAGRPSYNPKEIHSWYLFRTIIQGKVKIQRVGSTTYSRHHIVGRIINYLTFILLATLRSFPNKADVFLSMTDPPIAAIIGAILSYFRKKPFCYYIQDLHPDMALASGLVQYGPLVYIWDNIHRWALRKSSLIIALGEDMRKRIIKKGIAPEKIEVVRHGATIYENLPSPDHPIVQEIRCGFSFTVIHAGNLGFYGAWNTLIEAAKLLKQVNVGFVFVGDGAAEPMIKRLASSCDNVRFLPFRPLEEVPYVLAAGDIHIVTVRRGLEGTVVPSKLYPILAAGRPVLAVVPRNTDVSEIVTQNGCGIVADPDDPWSVVSAVRSLFMDRDQLKEMSRQALATAHEYEREKQLKRFVKLIEDVSLIENVMT